MTSLPRRILLATDGSEEAELVAGAAVEFARSTGSELHMVHIKLLPLTPPYPEVLGWSEDLGWAEREARELLDEQVKKVEDAGGTVAKIHLRGVRWRSRSAGGFWRSPRCARSTGHWRRRW